jgi:SAM-dependent methyltransferase
MKSYSSDASGVASLAREAWSLFQLHNRDIPGRVKDRLEDIRQAETHVDDAYGFRLSGRDILEIGPGQFLMQMSYLSMRNRTVGIDTDVIVRGFRPWDYAAMMRTSGPKRTAKTVVRKILGVDRKYATELRRQLNVSQLPSMTVYPMDVCKMSFDTEAFDFVYCRSVLHHLRDPLSAMEEIGRVLRPGGVAYISIHPFTSQTGCLDPRMYTNRWSEVKLWLHLRPHLQDKINKPNAFVNRLRLADWRKLFGKAMPGAKYILVPAANEVFEAARELQRQGELLEYSIEELAAGELVILWQKPFRDAKK